MGCSTIYSSIQQSALLVYSTPPFFILVTIVSKAFLALKQYSSIPVVVYILNSKDIPCPWAKPEYHGAFNSWEYSKSKLWLKQAIKGLEECIRYQTYEDGVNFEASIPYHRLVLEMFAYSAIIAKANFVKLSKKYYELMFKMFE